MNSWAFKTGSDREELGRSFLPKKLFGEEDKKAVNHSQQREVNMDKKKIQAVLAEEGYRPQWIEDRILIFKHEGDTYVVETDDDDALFLRIILPNFWSIESEEEYARVIAACEKATRKIKVAKIFTSQEGKTTWASIEMFIPSVDVFPLILNRCMSALTAALKVFLEAMRAEVPSQDRG